MKIFISHSSKDKEKIDEVVNQIKYLGVTVFYSSMNETNSIDAGEDFYKRILKEISECNYIIAILSEEFYKSTPSQIEMGMGYALEKIIIPILIDKDLDYKNLLRGIFTSNNRALSIYDKEQMMEILSMITDNPGKKINDIYKCYEKLEKSLRIIDEKQVAKNTIKGLLIKDISEADEFENENSILKYLNDGEFNINECLFLKYMWKNRKYNLEYGWQLEKGAQGFQHWVNRYFYELNGDSEEVYKNIVDHFYGLELLDEVEHTTSNNVKLYRLNVKYIRQLTNIFMSNTEIIGNECDKAIVSMPF